MPERKPWTAKERQLVRAEYRSLGAAELARRLGRTAAAVMVAAVRWKAVAPRRRPDGYEAWARRLHAEGKSLTQMSREMGLSVNVLYRWMRDVWRLPFLYGRGGFSEQARRELAARAKAWLASQGYGGPGQFRVERDRVEAANLGWPQAKTPQEARLLESLLAGGPQTGQALARQAGLAWRPRGKCWLRHVLARLLRRGLIASTRPRGAYHGKGGSAPVLYSLAPGVTKRPRALKHARENKPWL